MLARKNDYQCVACSAPHDHYADFCHACGSPDTVIVSESEEEESQIIEEYRKRQRAKRALYIDTSEPNFVSTGRPAWDEALSGGFVLPSSILVPGQSGVGKSTSLLRIADYISTQLRRPALYGSAEMPARNVRSLCNRLRLNIARLYINDSGRSEDMHDDILELRPAVIIWDSLQRFRVNDRIGVLEIRHIIQGAIEVGQRANAITIFTSHINKDEDFSGENGIAHDVDVVLWLHKKGPNLISVECPIKNRFGPTPKSAMEKLYESPNDAAHSH